MAYLQMSFFSSQFCLGVFFWQLAAQEKAVFPEDWQTEEMFIQSHQK